MRGPRGAQVVLAIAIVALAVWRLKCVFAGPEVDTDAYAHHIIARAILADPRDLAVHWVWLPVFHYLQVPLVALGGRLRDVRCLNVLLSAALPVVLYRYVRRTAQRGESGITPEATGLLAALFAAACPIAMQMGTTGQPEPLFALLVLGVAITYQDRRYGAAAWLLAIAAGLRYEAWAAVATIAAIYVVESLWRRRKGLAQEPEGWRALVIVGASVAVVVAWATLRKPFDGRWFGFLRETKQFANGVAHQGSALDAGFAALAHSAIYYPYTVALRVFGYVTGDVTLPLPLLLVPFGVVKTVREQGARFVLVLASALGFISFTWMMRSSLGLDRHFVVVVALYATFAAQGVAVIAGWVAWIAKRFHLPTAVSAATGRCVGAVVGVLSLGALMMGLDQWMGFWTASVARGWPMRERVGAFLRTLPEGAPIYCDDATIEILSGLDRRRFDRHWVDDPHTWELITNAAQAPGAVYVATWTDKMRGHESTGDFVYRARENQDDPASEISVLRVRPAERQASGIR
jgi:hypothetical protein